MFYFEDFLELNEILPQEVRDGLTEIRDLDSHIQNATDNLDDRSKSLFETLMNNESLATPDNPEFESIREDYYNALEDTDEKVRQATHLQKLASGYLRTLNKQLHKCKMELEADKPGSTEILEQRSLELAAPLFCDREERDRNFKDRKQNRFSYSTGMAKPKSLKKNGRKSLLKNPLYSGNNASGTSTSTYNLGHEGSTGYDSSFRGASITAAEIQAIAAQQAQGRRTASFKTSYNDPNFGMNSHEFNFGEDLVIYPELDKFLQADHQVLPRSTLDVTAGSSSGIEQKRNVRKTPHTDTSMLGILPESELLMPSLSAFDEIEPDDSNTLQQLEDLRLEDGVVQNPVLVYDVNEPRYCYCNNIYHGNMVACDSPSCRLEWFHYACVNLEVAPEGKWFCPDCLAAKKTKKRGRPSKLSRKFVK